MGTFAPSLTNLVRSLRTTLPGKCWFKRLSSSTSGVTCSEVIGERPVNNHFHALLLDAGVGVPQHEAVRSLFVVLAILQDQVDPFLPFVQVSRGAIEFHGLEIRHGLLALVDGDLERDRLQPVADRLHLY